MFFFKIEKGLKKHAQNVAEINYGSAKLVAIFLQFKKHEYVVPLLIVYLFKEVFSETKVVNENTKSIRRALYFF